MTAIIFTIIFSVLAWAAIEIGREDNDDTNAGIQK